MNQKSMLAIAAFVAASLLLSACNKQEAPAEQKPAVAQVEVLPVPADNNDDAAWKAYLKSVVKRNMEGVRSSPYFYSLPGAGAEDFEGQYSRQLDNVTGTVVRGVLPGNMLVFGSPESARMADLVVAAFGEVQAGSLKDVRVLFIGRAEDLGRVKAAVEPSGANLSFHETK